MSTTIDQKVVEMRFDNKQFEVGAQTSISTLDKLKQSLNLSGVSKGLNDISTATKNIGIERLSGFSKGLEDIGAKAKCIDIDGLTSSVGVLGAKFSALQVAGLTALANITNSAVNAGKRIAMALTIDPIKTGFQEYETQINAVQTILANTESKGSTLEDVNKALDELNLYADKTIYNFTEMTRNIGTFTAAGVELDTSVSAIKGIANLAAVSGSNSQQASTAMYQLSQALAAGTVKLMDWNSVVNAGMGGQVFQDALKETARVHGIKIDEMIKKEGSFRETLQNGWLSSEILTETLAKFTGDLTEEQLKSMGYTEEQTKKILKMGQTANDAATKVKTFTQLFDTLKEAAQSGWTQTWEILIGDFEEAKALLTEISDAFSAIIGKSADSRNKLLQGWKDLGGRTDMIDSFRSAFEAIVRIIKPISQAFREIFPQATAKQLKTISEGLKIFTEKLKISEKTADKIKRTFKGVFSIFDIFRKALLATGKIIADLFLSGGITSLADLFLSITASIGDFFTSLNNGMNFDGVSNGLSKVVSSISGLIKKAVGGLEGFTNALSIAGSAVANFAKNIWNALSGVFDWIGDNVSIGDIFAGLAGGGVFLAAKKFSGLLNTIKESIENLFGGKEKAASLKKTFSDVLGSVKDSLMSFTSGVKVVSLLTIAGSIAILSAALKTISKLKVPDLTKSMTAIGIMLGMLSLSFKSITKTLNRFSATGIMKSGASLILMAGAIKVLADAMVKISSLSLEGVAKGLTAIGVGLTELTFGLKMINKVEIKISTSIALLALAKSCQMLGDALAKFGGMSWGGIVKGLVGMGGALAEFVIVLNRLSKLSGAKSIVGSISLLIAVQSLGKLADGFKKFGEMSWNGIGRGLVGMGGALTEVAGISGVLGKIAGFSGILGSIAIVLVVDSLSKLADSFKKFGEMSWGGIVKGLAGMGGALAEVAGISGALGKIAGISGILGSSAILIAVQGLGKLAEAFKEFGGMSWSEIGRGLVGMGGALAEVAGMSGGLGVLAGLSGVIGGAAIWTSVQGLGDLANAFKKFGEMSWDEIKRGLASMGGALGELAVGGVLNTFSILGSLSISTMSEDLGVLADSLKKWTNILVPENLGEQLGLLAKGIMQFTFGGAGASVLATSAEAVGTLAASAKKWADIEVSEDIKDKMSLLSAGIMTFTFSEIGGAALATSAEAVGILADSVRKWENVSVPENIEDGLKSIANGVSTFASTFVGGWSMSSVTEPLKELANAVTKWNKISVPESLGEELSNLAGGINNFAWSFMSGWSLDTIVEPLGALASSVLKWKGVSVPEGISEKLESLADGVKAFIGAAKGGKALGIVASPLGTLADSVKKWSDVSIPSDLTENLGSLADGVKKFKGIKDITKTVSSIDKLANAAKKMSGTDFNAVNAGLNKFVSSLNNNIGKFTASGVKIGQALSNGITKGVSKIKPEVLKTLTSIVAVIKEYRARFYAAGAYVVDGFAKGISANTYKARARAKAMANAAEEAAKNALDENSPSKVFYKIGDFAGMGFVNGLASYADKARDVSNEMGVSAKKGLKFAISRINDFISSDIETSPTIRPVLDLSDVTSNARSLSGLLESNPAIGLTGSINTMMNRRVQNGINEDVVSAINKLAGKLGNIGGDSYTINGVTYDDGSNVSDAVKTLVRAAKVERRV